jgi:hypothetical protein
MAFLSIPPLERENPRALLHAGSQSPIQARFPTRVLTHRFQGSRFRASQQQMLPPQRMVILLNEY